MNGEKMEKTIEEELDKFLYAVEDFISVNAEYYIYDVKVIYMTQWQEGKGKMFARGLIKIGEAFYPVHMVYNIKTSKLVIRSPIFLFYLNNKDIQDFLVQAETEEEN